MKRLFSTLMNKKIFSSLCDLFEKNGYKLYMIGGSSRDFLLGVDFVDYDFVTDATPDEMKEFLKDANYTFEKFGSVKVKFEGIKADITTFRKEEGYGDFRHPNKITFVKSIEEDYRRRDLTINAIYINKDYEVIDPSNGKIDLENKLIRFIGDPEKRIQEDPLRILRAERFAKKLNFKFEEKTAAAIEKYRYLLDKLNPDKVAEEARKAK